MAIGDTNQPINGIPSLTASELLSLYAKYNIVPGPTDLSSDQENALKYSAAGIERQIALRAGNVPNSGIRGDENLAPLTVAATVEGHAVTLGVAAVAPPPAGGPTGTTTFSTSGGFLTPSGSPVALAPGVGPISSISVGGIDLTTILIGAVALGAAWYLWKHR